MHILVVGAGSIGQRHIKNLVELGVDRVSVVDTDINRARLQSQKDNNKILHYYYLQSVLDQKPDAAVVAVPTHLHGEISLDIIEDRSYPFPIFIEKPLTNDLTDALTIQHMQTSVGTWGVVGYSLRFHPALQIIRDLLPQIGTPLYARAEVGQYLPDWHPTEDYRNWYMAHENQGGGALLDLSHELDYMRWLFGTVELIGGVVDQTSDMEIDSDDVAEVLVRHLPESTIGSIHMDLLDRSYNRRLRVIGAEGTIAWNYSDGYVGVYTPGRTPPVAHPYNTDRNIQFLEEMRAFVKSVETGVVDERFATLEDGIEVLKVVDALKRQNGRGQYGC